MGGSYCVQKGDRGACFQWETPADNAFALLVAENTAIGAGDGATMRSCNDQSESCGAEMLVVRDGQLRATPIAWIVSGGILAVAIGTYAAVQELRRQ